MPPTFNGGHEKNKSKNKVLHECTRKARWNTASSKVRSMLIMATNKKVKDPQTTTTIPLGLKAISLNIKFKKGVLWIDVKTI